MDEQHKQQIRDQIQKLLEEGRSTEEIIKHFAQWRTSDFDYYYVIQVLPEMETDYRKAKATEGFTAKAPKAKGKEPPPPPPKGASEEELAEWAESKKAWDIRQAGLEEGGVDWEDPEAARQGLDDFLSDLMYDEKIKPALKDAYLRLFDEVINEGVAPQDIEFVGWLAAGDLGTKKFTYELKRPKSTTTMLQPQRAEFR